MEKRELVRRPLYDVHPGVAIMQAWIAELKSSTGRSLDEWLVHCRRHGPRDEEACRDWLKNEHALGANAAGWLAERAGGAARPDEDTPEGYLASAVAFVEAQYAGAKAALRPLFDALVALGRELGEDVRVCPCKTMVPLYRKHVFAQLKPATRTRVDLGLALAPLIGRRTLPPVLIDTGGFKKKDRITHRIEITTARDINATVRKWLATAYSLDT